MHFEAEVQLTESEQLQKERTDTMRAAELLREAAALLSKQDDDKSRGE
ncbi:hypothetical protein [Staphylococcus simulans]|nr:hypothetical protein [Staphylococcus simulans]UXV42144.1 hypothetical protein MUA12_11755 [Staphylococcus simulans]